MGDHRLEINPIVDFGYLVVETDAKTLHAVFKTADDEGVVARDSVTVDLKSRKLISPAGGSGRNRNGQVAMKVAKKPAKKKRR